MGSRGLKMPGGGYDAWVEPAPEFRASSHQACGLYPFAVGGQSPVVGVPLGFNIRSGETVCCDCMAWFEQAKILQNPSSATLGLPALGKSTGERKELIGLVARGIVPIVAGDLKPDYADVVEALGGQVIEMGRGAGSLNPLDPGTLDEAAAQLSGDHYSEARRKLQEEAHGRRVNMVLALITILRGHTAGDVERTVLSTALRALVERHEGHQAPVLADLVQILEPHEAPQSVKDATMTRGDQAAYTDLVTPLQRTLNGLVTGELGDTFARPTSTRLKLDAPAICVDISGLNLHDNRLTAAVLLATWNEVFGTVWANNVLTDTMGKPQRHFKIILDELWRVLGAGPGMTDAINHMGRTNRQQGLGQSIITHTLADFSSLPDGERQKAYGFIERSALLKLYGLPRHEVEEIDRNIVSLTNAEKQLLTSWSTPRSLDSNAAPPGLGKVLLKVAHRPGIPVQIQLTEAELRSGVHNTNKRWAA